MFIVIELHITCLMQHCSIVYERKKYASFSDKVLPLEISDN